MYTSLECNEVLLNKSQYLNTTSTQATGQQLRDYYKVPKISLVHVTDNIIIDKITQSAANKERLAENNGKRSVLQILTLQY